ncbi:hypothetical protein TRFO_09264 [Tritrichomonas foetus]|uniref:Uncharacterized protein n=1 Tax=Tritrichomonas foetus TaxID=1144522 RepID=A0A1J4JHV3_9EUKA|nr:hypothetical protein TRFO_09264 [Tritrichomonas foetus]|eukprot:OHS97831.1 hypothetical protein TRFO_09264 [Tritrichomonas foetus]
MNIEEKTHAALQTSSWCNPVSFQKSDARVNTVNIETQNVLHQICIFRYFGNLSNAKSDLVKNISYEKILSSTNQTPLRIHAKMSPNFSQFFIQWVLDYATNPKILANSILNTLPHFPAEEDFFISVTFPSIFYHFQTIEYLNLAVEFLKEIIIKSPTNYAIPFVAAFLNGSTKFLFSIWNIFDEIVLKNSPILSSASYFTIFTEALKKASCCFTKQHFQIIHFFKEQNLNAFCFCFFSKFLLQSFEEKYLCQKNEIFFHPLYDILNFTSKNPSSPHFKMIFDALTEKNGTFWVPQKVLKNKEYLDLRTPIVLCCHELLMLQNIAQENPDISKLKCIRNLTIPQTFSEDFHSIYLEVTFPSNLTEQTNKISPLIFHQDPLFESDPISNQKSDIFEKKWQQITTFSKHNCIQPLSIFDDHSKAQNLLENYGITELNKNSDLFFFALKKVYSNCLNSQNNFEWFIKRSLNSSFYESIHETAKQLLEYIIQSFNVKYCENIIYNFYKLREFPISNPNRSKSYSIVRFASNNVKSSKNNRKNNIYSDSNSKNEFENNYVKNEMYSPKSRNDILNKNRKSKQFIAILKKSNRIPKRSHSAETNKEISSSFHLKSVIQKILNHSIYMNSFCLNKNSQKMKNQQMKNKYSSDYSMINFYMILKTLDFWRNNDKVLNNLKKSFTLFLELFKEKQNKEKQNYQSLNSECTSALTTLIKEINILEKFKKGSAILSILKISEKIHQISLHFSLPKLLIFTKLLVSSRYESFFEAFILCEKIMNEFPYFRVYLTESLIIPFQVIEECFFAFFFRLDQDLTLRIIDYIKYLF